MDHFVTLTALTSSIRFVRVEHRTVTRLTGASKSTVAKLLIDAGKAYADYHDKTVRKSKPAARENAFNHYLSLVLDFIPIVTYIHPASLVRGRRL
jgi:hypothetical protein